MRMNLPPVSFAILSGALMLVGSSIAFANPDHTNPRDSAVTAACSGAVSCETVSQDRSVTPAASTSAAASNESMVTSDHDARKDRNHVRNR